MPNGQKLITLRMKRTISRHIPALMPRLTSLAFSEQYDLSADCFSQAIGRNKKEIMIMTMSLKRDRSCKSIGFFLILILFINLEMMARGQGNNSKKPALAEQKLPEVFSKRIEVNEREASLANLLKITREKTGLNFLVDGKPLKTGIAIQGAMTTKSLLDIVSQRFDYHWTLSRSGVVLFSKRFSDHAERPQVNLAEMQQMAKEIVEAIDSLQFDLKEVIWGDQIVELADSFSPQQLAYLQTGKPILGKELNLTGQNLLRSIVYNRDFAEAKRIWTEELLRLQNMKNSYLIGVRNSNVTEEKLDVGLYLYSYLHIVRDPLGVLHQRGLQQIRIIE